MEINIDNINHFEIVSYRLYSSSKETYECKEKYFVLLNDGGQIPVGYFGLKSNNTIAELARSTERQILYKTEDDKLCPIAN